MQQTYTLTVLDTPGIQRYIFGSNRLRENIGASELVRCASSLWPLEILHQTGASNIRDPVNCDFDDDKHIEDGQLTAEVVYVGGGNTVVLFRDRAQAVQFVNRLSRKLLEEAPGLDLAVAHVSVNLKEDHLGQKVNKAMQQLAQNRRTRRPSVPLLGLGVTAACQSTGLVATTTNAEHGKPEGEETYPISSEVAAKLEMVDEAKSRLHNLLPEIQDAGYDIPSDFDDFGRSEGEMSYIAVVHADGNGMGQFFREIARKHLDSREYIQKVRAASWGVTNASQEALRRIGEVLLGAVEFDDKAQPSIRGVVSIQDDKLPFRPIVFGGDDLTFVCDGRLGLTLAARYLQAFEEKTRKVDLNLHACAGVAVVKVHYPFARAYQLSEALAGSAKRYVRDNPPDDFSALDWHFAAGGLLGSLDEIRTREYQVSEGMLAMRPLRLQEQRPEWRTWPRFIHVVEEFTEGWADRRNKVIALREALREGTGAVQRFLTAYGEKLPILDKSVSNLQETGWSGHICGYFDAIEALDFYVPLLIRKEVLHGNVYVGYGFGE